MAQELSPIPVPGLTPLGLKSDLDHESWLWIWRMFYFAWSDSSDIGMTYRYHDILASFRETTYQLLGWASPDRCWTLGWFEWWHSTRNGVKKQQQRGCYGSSMIQKYWFGNKPDFTKTRSTVCHFRQRNYIEYWDFQATKRFMFHLLAKRVIFAARNEWKVAGSWEMPCMSPVLWMVGKSSISS